MTALASPIRVIDGDTFIAIIEVRSKPIWLHGMVLSGTFLERIRVLGVNAPERTNRVKYEESKSFTTKWMGCDNPGSCKGAKILTVCSDGYDDFGRALATVKRDDGNDLAYDLIFSGMGIKFP